MKPFTQENFEKFVLYRSSLQQPKNYERMIIAIKNKYELSEEREDIVRGHMNDNPFKYPKETTS